MELANSMPVKKFPRLEANGQRRSKPAGAAKTKLLQAVKISSLIGSPENRGENL
jgi:hypothetical protein